MQTIHISGASGFLGSNLCNHYLNKGLSVNAIVRAGSEVRVAKSHSEKLRFTVIDFSRIDELDFSITPSDIVIHTASSNPRITDFRFKDLLSVNVEFGYKLMSLAADSNSKFLNIGTNWQHYENRRYSPVSQYAASKEAHLAFQHYFTEVENLNAKNLELCDTYGTNDPRDKLVPLLMHSREDQWPLDLTNGNQLIDLVNIEDVVAAVDLVTTNWDSNLDELNMSLTSKNLISVRELVDVCSQIRGIDIPVSWGAVAPQHVRQMQNSWAYYKVPFGWEPRVDLQSGLAKIQTRMKEQN
jgi:CDP-paratose synthetase